MPTLSGTWQFITEPEVDGNYTFIPNITFWSNRLLFKQMFVDHYCVNFKPVVTGSLVIPYSKYNNAVLGTEKGWVNDRYQVVTFTNTQTVDDDFYTWFTANARQVPGGRVSGKWKFNEVLTPIGETYLGIADDIRQSVNFTWVRSGTVNTAKGFTQYDTFGTADDGSTIVEDSTLVFGLGYGAGRYNFTTNKWAYSKDQYDRTVDFGETEQPVSYDFYTWLLDNARPVGAYVPTEIAYNGVNTSVEVGKTATLSCNGKRAKTDIVVVFGSPGSITYNGTETSIEAGQTATLSCAEKRMKTDVVVSL